MNFSEFKYLFDALDDAITVSYVKSWASTDGNDPIYPEVVMACGLRFLALNDSPQTLSDLYGMSVSSAKRVINMFLDAVDYYASKLAYKLHARNHDDEGIYDRISK